MKISIIIPVYNVEKYLRESLNSVLNQTLNDIEVICVDDCSTDNSFNILFNLPFISLIFSSIVTNLPYSKKSIPYFTLKKQW